MHNIIWIPKFYISSHSLFPVKCGKLKVSLLINHKKSSSEWYFLGMAPSLGVALADNFQPSWKRASAGVGFGGALAENEGTSLN